MHARQAHRAGCVLQVRGGVLSITGLTLFSDQMILFLVFWFISERGGDYLFIVSFGQVPGLTGLGAESSAGGRDWRGLGTEPPAGGRDWGPSPRPEAGTGGDWGLSPQLEVETGD